MFSGFIQDEISLVPGRLLLTLGTKYEYNPYTDSEWQPSARMLWKPHDRHTLWLSAARAVRTPAMVERDGKVLTGLFPGPMGPSPIYMTGNDAFESEVLFAYESGYRWQATERLFFDAAFFYNDYDKVLTVNTVASATGMRADFANSIGGKSYGFELAADWKATDALNFSLAYSYIHLSLDDNSSAAEAFGDIRNKNTPQHQLSMRGSYKLLSNLQINLWGRYHDNFATHALTEIGGKTYDIDSSFTLDANLIWAPVENLELMLAGQNLLDSRQLNYVSEYAIPPTEIERSIYGKVTWRF